MTSTQWRIMGQWRDGRRFLVVLGKSPADCMLRLNDALDDWAPGDADRAETLWLEQYDCGTILREPRWIAVKEVPLRRFKRRANARVPGERAQSERWASAHCCSKTAPRSQRPQAQAGTAASPIELRSPA